MNNNQKVRAGFSVMTNRPGRASSGMKKITYRPEWDDPALAKVKAKKKRAAAKRKSSTRKAR